MLRKRIRANRFEQALDEIVSFIRNSRKVISREQINSMINELVDAYNRNRMILVVGAGRSGLVGRAFAMRLMHLGFNVHVLGDTITPAVRKDDIVIAVSGSGTTKLVVTAAEAAKIVGAKVIAITSYPESPLGSLADLVVQIPGRTKVARESDFFSRQILGIHEPLAPLGTLFEITTMIVLDSIIVALMEKLGQREEDLKERHANIEL